MAPNELVVKVSRPSGRSVKTAEQVIRGLVVCAPEAAAVAAVRKQLRIAKPEAAAC